MIRKLKAENDQILKLKYSVHFHKQHSYYALTNPSVKKLARLKLVGCSSCNII